MRLAEEKARRRLVDHDHGVFCTVHPEHGVDAVPVVYAVDSAFVGMPVDLVEPEASTRLQRERNLEADRRAALLVEQWERHDWSGLWWVRAQLRWENAAGAELVDPLASRLADRYPQYADQPFERVPVLRIVGLTGWSATAG